MNEYSNKIKFTFENFNMSLDYKKTLLLQFSESFLSKEDINIKKESPDFDINNYVYISKIIKSKEGYSFKLSNDTLEMAFLDDKTLSLDNTQIFTNKNETGLIIYINEIGISYLNYKCALIIEKKLNLKNEIIQKSKKNNFIKRILLKIKNKILYKNILLFYNLFINKFNKLYN